MCNLCDSDGYKYEYREMQGKPPMLWAIKCECGKNEMLKFEAKVSASGVGESFKSYTLDSFRDTTDELVFVKQKAKNYAKDFSSRQFDKDNGLLICGRVGSGKTHLASAVSNRLMQSGFALEYFEYRERIIKLKQTNMDYEKYKGMMESIKNVKILFIDDLFKGKVTEAEINIVYEVVNNRYQRNLPVIITTEKKPEDLLAIDEAVGSRILEMCKQNIINISNIENYRLK